jgi:hypothetical protein
MSKNAFGYVDQLPENIRDSFMWLCQDVASLQHKWDFYLELFGKNQNTDLLSELAPASFNIIFETLQNDITMAICRLSDPPKSMGQENLSLATLVKNCTEIEGLDGFLTDFQNICEPVRQRRNKRVGHRDLNTVIKPLENPLPGVSKEQIDIILKTAAAILNSVLQNYDNGELNFHTISPGGADSLIFWLKTGKGIQVPRPTQRSQDVDLRPPV